MAPLLWKQNKRLTNYFFVFGFAVPAVHLGVKLSFAVQSRDSDYRAGAQMPQHWFLNCLAQLPLFLLSNHYPHTTPPHTHTHPAVLHKNLDISSPKLDLQIRNKQLQMVPLPPGSSTITPSFKSSVLSTDIEDTMNYNLFL